MGHMQHRPSDDPRGGFARFQPGAVLDQDQNLELVEAVGQMAQRRDASLASVALSWVQRQGAVPLPGASKVDQMVQNGDEVELDEVDLGAPLRLYWMGGKQG